MKEGDIVRFVDWDATRRSAEELKLCAHFKLQQGEVTHVGIEASVVSWNNTNFNLDGSQLSGKFMLETWNSEIEVVNGASESPLDQKDSDDQNQENTEPNTKSPFNSVIDELEKKYGEDLGLGPEPTDDEVTGPIIFTNHPERWPVRDIGNRKFKWNGEIWLEVDLEDLMPKEDGEKLRKERKPGEQKWSDSMIEPIRETQDVKDRMDAQKENVAPDANVNNHQEVRETLDEIEKAEKLEFVRRKKYGFDKATNNFKTPEGRILTADQVKELYENDRIYRIFNQRLEALIANDKLSASQVNFCASIYRQFKEKGFFSPRQMMVLAEILHKHRVVVQQLQGPKFRPITSSRNLFKQEFVF